MKHQQPYRLPEIRLTLPGTGEETVWDWSLSPIMDVLQPGQVQYILIAAVEITEQVRVREEVERLDAMKDQFLSAVSHELRTPLTSLIGYTHIMGGFVAPDRPPLSPQHLDRIRQYIDRFGTQLGRLKRLIDDLVDVSRLQSGKLTLVQERIPLNAVVERAVEDARMLSGAPPIHFVIVQRHVPLFVRGDPTRLTQVLLNLLQNALIYAPQSEQIEVCLDVLRDEASGAQYAQIEVQDQGPGIPLEEQVAIFDRFYQVSRSSKRASTGLGLGLFISKQIIEQHRGTISVRSVVGQGTTFIVHVPLVSWNGFHSARGGTHQQRNNR